MKKLSFLILSIMFFVVVSSYADTLNEDLIQVVKKDRSAKVIELIKKGADVNAKDKAGRSALYIASGDGSIKTVNALLDKGADVNAKSPTDKTALMAAAQFGWPEVVKALIAKGADVNAKTKNGKTALDIAKDNEHPKIVEILKSHGAK